MRLHGTVSLTLLALTHSLFAQDFSVPPRPIDSLDRQVAPDLSTIPQPAGPRETADRGLGESSLEGEIEGLHSDLQAFHALSDEVARSARAAEADADRSMVRQRQELLDVLTKLATQGITKKPADWRPTPVAEPVLSATPESIAVPDVTDAAVDQFALGKVLFRAAEYAKAEQAFRKVVATDENRTILKYLIATCLRKRSQWQPAIEGYREVAASDKDPVLRDLAKFQLDGIRWNQETERQIESLRKQREKQTPALKTSP